MKKISLLLLTLVFSLFMQSCKEDEPTDPNEQKLANKDWLTDGVYVNVSASPTKTIDPNIKVRFRNTNLGKSVELNGVDLTVALAPWSINADATLLTVKYPTTTIANPSAISYTTQTLKIVRLDEDELWLTTPDGTSEIKLFGLITITNTMQYRFKLGSGTTTSLTNATLTAVTWSANANAQAGVFVNNGEGYIKNNAINAPLEFKFQQGFPAIAGQTLFTGTNILLISGIPSSIWGIDNATTPTKLSMSVPTIGTLTFDIAKLDADELWLTYTGANNVTVFGVALSANNQLRFVPKI